MDESQRALRILIAGGALPCLLHAQVEVTSPADTKDIEVSDHPL